jgi:hypothetical protein
MAVGFRAVVKQQLGETFITAVARTLRVLVFDLRHERGQSVVLCIHG